ncbi:MAG TPA: DUF5703 domain-containing protein [Fimbriimonadaceae bacterium]|nr:DUF5703 domain-containing protein [Fimbriimonadaceae bacterium]
MLLQTACPAAKLDAQDVVWTTPSADAAGSMPIGNGEVVLNVWVEEKTGDLLFYIARTDALSEISRYLKLGRIRVHFQPNVLSGKDFRQHLHLHDGTIEISGGGADFTLFVDSGANVIHLLGTSAKPLAVDAKIESWRNRARTLPLEEKGSAWSVHDAPFPLVESPDIFVDDDYSTWYHRNESSVVPKLWANQSLTGLKGTFDPLIHRTFGGMFQGQGFKAHPDGVQSIRPLTRFDLKIATESAQTASFEDWRALLRKESAKSGANALTRTKAWWHAFWDRSWVFVKGDGGGEPVPTNKLPLLKGRDQNGENVFQGEIEDWQWIAHQEHPRSDNPVDVSFPLGFSLSAQITPRQLKPGRIFDKMTPGGNDGFIFDTHPGDALRLIVGNLTLTTEHCLKAGASYRVAAVYDPRSGEAAIYRDGERVAWHEPEEGSPVTRGYTLQRYVQACQGRGAYPIKFNGGFYTVEPKAMGKPFDPDFRNWGDSHWWQNVRHMYHPMLEQGDFEMMDPLFRMYESVVPLAESRTKLYHQCEGVYFPETMTIFGTYSGGDYGWDRTGHKPEDVLCPWWQYAWNQGPELVALMLDRWDYTRDPAFLKKQVLPMAAEVLKYFDTRFKRDAQGKIVLDPTQVVETYWQGVVNDMPSTAGLIAITSRLCALPSSLVSPGQRTFFARMKAACPDLPIEEKHGHRELAPAQKYVDKTTNVENGQLYAVWPFQVVTIGHPTLLAEAKAAYADRLNHLDVGWGYDGNVAALLGMTDEAARILKVKCRNSHAGYRWPATWGPNFDWLPDQNHGGNLLNTANLMLLQSEPLEEGGAIRLLPAWPKNWDVDFKLHAAGNTTVHCRTQGGKIVELEVTPASRRKDVVMPPGW